MRNDSQIETAMYDLLQDVQEWIGYVESTGNQCAFSDRQLESAIDKAIEIKELYEKN